MKKIRIIQLGLGTVGWELVQLMRDRQGILARDRNIEITIVALADAEVCVANTDGIDLTQAAASRDVLISRMQTYHGWDDLKQRVDGIAGAVVIDVTAASLSYIHADVVRHEGIIVTANKKPLTDSMDIYRVLHADTRKYFYECTVGSSSPVIQTLQDLVATGDEIIEIQATLSGTLGYLCSELKKGELSFSAIVRQARDHGFTEPHPRDDLSGKDVARKALILGREIGLELEMHDVQLISLLPAAIESIDEVDDFLNALRQLDSEYREKITMWREQGRTPQFIARITKGGISVGLEGVALFSPLGQLSGPDNMVTFHTRIFKDKPLVLQGRGAGALFTAEGVLQDVMRAARIE